MFIVNFFKYKLYTKSGRMFHGSLFPKGGDWAVKQHCDDDGIESINDSYVTSHRMSCDEACDLVAYLVHVKGIKDLYATNYDMHNACHGCGKHVNVCICCEVEAASA